MRTKKGNPLWCAVTADIVESRQIKGLNRWRDRKLRELSAIHQREGLTLAPYAVTTWDEFQSLTRPALAPRLILGLRLHFYPRHLRIGVGIGGLLGAPGGRKPVNVALGGAAFENARDALESLKSHRKSDALTAFRSPDGDLDIALNLIYHLHDTLLRQVTPRQWETLRAYSQSSPQELAAAAESLGISVSTASRTLQRGHYWQMEETVAAVSEILQNRFPDP